MIDILRFMPVKKKEEIQKKRRTRKLEEEEELNEEELQLILQAELEKKKKEEEDDFLSDEVLLKRLEMESLKDEIRSIISVRTGAQKSSRENQNTPNASSKDSRASKLSKRSTSQRGEKFKTVVIEAQKKNSKKEVTFDSLKVPATQGSSPSKA